MTKTTPTYKAVSASLLLAATFAAGAWAGPSRAAGARQRAEVREARVPRGPLWEVTGRRRVALLVSKSLVVDAREPALAALEDYGRALAGSPPRLHAAGARIIAARLNKYIRKSRMMSAAGDYAEADLVIVYKVTGQRPSAIPTEPFVWGKMYVIALGSDRVARVVWESEGDNTSAEDAADDFIKAFRAARGEK
ncbi:MAG: hypothetical protein LC795_23100 [Acidobacteria bacterium]|nr:hypothetical protein [Acidobacteriota bacterium]